MKDYDVGYGKPPKSCQWKPGESGNPSGGKSKKSPLLPLVSEIAAQLNEFVKIKDGDKFKKITVSKAFSIKMMHDLMHAPLKDKLAGLQILQKLGVLHSQYIQIDQCSSEQPSLTEDERQLMEMIRAEMENWDDDEDDGFDQIDQ